MPYAEHDSRWIRITLLAGPLRGSRFRPSVRVTELGGHTRVMADQAILKRFRYVMPDYDAWLDGEDECLLPS